ncbi:putative ribonuclease H-like domain-containing protein [Rosa chinensis]|uniref:Putative ribonuclease H-like domain-containing protein n=1 Tax=Rosa chinensis TaxID=74649 RepID=A0A2P6QIV4_ROSCH|nr:putative ribonuclease H-like domain-containing protein [Rosa chinensis]
MAAMARYFPNVLSAFHMEAEACRAGLLLAIYQEWDEFILESDCSLMVAALNQNLEDRSEVGRIIDDCKSYLTSLHSIKISHVFREANGVANRLAHLASSKFLNDVWLEEAPVIIQDVLYEDFCNCTRGQGSTSPSMHSF